MVDEMAPLNKNNALDAVELSARRKHIRIRWVLKNNTNAEGMVEK